MKIYEQFLNDEIKAEIMTYYIDQNHSLKECQYYLNKKYGITSSTLISIMRAFNIHKPKDLHTQQIKKTKYARYGSENYNGHANFKFEYSASEEKEICDRYLAGENIWAINRDLHTHKAKSILLKHDIPLRSESENNKLKIEKIKQTNLGKYGVDNIAKDKKIIKKIKDTWHNKSADDFLEIKNKS